VSLRSLGWIEEGREAVVELLKLKPDFPEHRYLLIRHFIKFEEIVDRIVEGLEKSD
jgi:adenylate cyclase